MKSIIKITVGVILAYLVITNLSTVLSFLGLATVFTANGVLVFAEYAHDNMTILAFIFGLPLFAFIVGKIQKSKKGSK